jgi:hypothetical protein
MSYVVFIGAAVTAWAVLRYVLAVESDALVLSTMLVFALVVSVWANRYTKMAWLLLDLYLHPVRSEDFEPRGRN